METLRWIQWLLERYWTVRFNARQRLWEWRDPYGISGDDYQSTRFNALPPAVERHILGNALIAKED